MRSGDKPSENSIAFAGANVKRGGEGDPALSGIFGRDREFVQLAAFLDAIAVGPRVLLLEGEAGVGKTTVWRWALNRARATGYRVLSCSPAETEAKYSYAGLGDVLESMGDNDWPDLPAPQRRALDIVLLRDDEEGVKVDPRAVATAVLACVRSLAATTPTLIAVDDVQWLDLASARVLQFVVRRLHAERIGVLASLRTPSRDGVPLGLDRALPGNAFSSLQIGPLSVGALHHALRSRLGSEFPRAVLIRLHETSGGNPFYALEIGRYLMDHDVDPANTPAPTLPLRGRDISVIPIPRSLQELVERRLAFLPRRTYDVLLVVAALSQPTLAQVAAAAEHPETAGADIGRASRLGLVDVDGSHVRFSHPLLASVRYQAASPGQRSSLHRRLAEVVVDIEERARHLALATTAPDPNVAALLDEAAARARSRGAPEAAAALLEEACRLTPTGELEARWKRASEAAMCHYLAGETERARFLWEEIERSVSPGPARAAALWHLVEFRNSNLHLEEQVAAMDRALREAGDDLALKSAIHQTLAMQLTYGGDARRALVHARATLELAAAQADPATTAMACSTSAHVEFMSGLGVSTGLVDRALDLEWATRDLPIENSPRLFRAFMLSMIGEAPEAARHEYLDLRRRALDSGVDVSVPLLLFAMSDHECRTGDWDLADLYASECVEAAARSEQSFRAPLGLLAMALLDARRGRLETARGAAAEALAAARRAGPRYVEARIWAVLGYIELADGHHKAAHGWLRQVIELEETGGYDEPTVFRGAHDEIETLIELGELEEADRLVHRLERRGGELNRAWALAVGARCRGLVAAARGDLAAAQVALEQALVEHERLTEPFELGRTLLVLGNLQRRRRQKQAARATLQRAQAVFQALGASSWATAAADEIQRAGLHLAGREQLTPTEERVAKLVAAGRTNREIAGALFITAKAVEANLTRIYAKLEVRSRTELALRLAARQTPDKA